MTLIKSISGIRGTIGGKAGEGLSPLDIVKFTSAYAVFIKKHYNITDEKATIVVGRDARISGEMVMNMVCSTLNSMGCDVININYATTPTTEIAVTEFNADGGIIITASHNPKQWNALKLLNRDGEFLDAAQGEEIIKLADNDDFTFSEIDKIGKTTRRNDALDIHIKKY
jgi:phosphomannomutase